MNTWREAYDAQVRRIEQHPDFGRLIREAAITEQPDVRYSRAYLNSPTFGSWMIRTGAPRISQRRAVYFTVMIAQELGVPQGWAERDLRGHDLVSGRACRTGAPAQRHRPLREATEWFEDSPRILLTQTHRGPLLDRHREEAGEAGGLCGAGGRPPAAARGGYASWSPSVGLGPLAAA